MTILYSCRHDGQEYRITKWNDGNVESSYLCSEDECECPAGVRPSCRHREMLPYFISRNAINTGWWFDWDRGGWVDMREELEEPEAPETQDSSAVEQGAHNALVDGSIPSPATNGAHGAEVSTAEFDSADVGSIPAVPATPYRKPRDGRRA